MLAGMGGVSYHRLVAAVSEAGGFGCMGASTMGAEQMRDEIAKVRELTAKPFGVDLLTAAPGDMTAKVNDIIDGGGSVFVAGLGVPRDVVDLCHSRNVLVVSMCGKVRHAIAAVEAGLRHRRRPGHRGRRPHRQDRHVRPRAADRRRGRRAGAGGGGRRHRRRSGPGRRPSPSAPTASGSAPASSPRPEANSVPGYKEALLRTHEDGTVITRAYTGKTCRVIENSYTKAFDADGGVPEPFPMQVVKRMQEGANHLGGDPSTPDVDPDREFWPAGQGVGSHRRARARRRAGGALRAGGRGGPRHGQPGLRLGHRHRDAAPHQRRPGGGEVDAGSPLRR